MKLEGKTVIVTGATGGIGSELAKEFAKEGANLILISRNEEKLHDLLHQLLGTNHKLIVFDLKHADNFSDLIKSIRDKTQVVDVLINNAGIGVYKPLEEANDFDWHESMAINVTAPYLLTKHLLPLMQRSEKAVVVNVGSGMGIQATAGRSIYCTSKFALRGMSLSLAEEFKNTNISIVHIALGSTLTDFGPLSLQQKEEENLKGKSYFTPSSVAKKFVEIVKRDNIDDEVELYPSVYKKVI